VRVRTSQARTHALNYHRGVVCGLAFGPDGRLATGGNDGLLNVWDLRRLDVPMLSFDQHRAAAVKAIAWHPDVRNVLASGGGSADRYLRLWDIDARRCFNRRDSRSQVTGLLWSTRHNELISSHGYSEDTALAVWSTPALLRVAHLHEINRRERALYMVGSHCGRFIATADTLRTLSFYSLFVSDVDAHRGGPDDDDDDDDGSGGYDNATNHGNTASLSTSTARTSASTTAGARSHATASWPLGSTADATVGARRRRVSAAPRSAKRGRMTPWTIR